VQIWSFTKPKDIRVIHMLTSPEEQNYFCCTSTDTQDYPNKSMSAEYMIINRV